MKIILTSSKKNAASFIFYSESLKKINDSFPDITFETSNTPSRVDYGGFDVALFMGYDEESTLAKQQNKDIITGILDPRTGQKNSFQNVDLIVANDIESKDYFSQFSDNIVIYHTYPSVPEKQACPIDTNKLILGYHGNKIHLDAMYPRITEAIERLNRDIDVELWAMYNIKKLGKWNRPEKQSFKFAVRHIQYSEQNYAKYMAHSDIGLTPQLIPVSKNRILMYLLGTFNNEYNEHNDTYLLRFKETTNRGRHLIFAQYGIPVVSDMTPSASDFIDYGASGFVAHHTESWYQALLYLANNTEQRAKMGKSLKNKYLNTALPRIQNQYLISFLNKIKVQND